MERVYRHEEDRKIWRSATEVTRDETPTSTALHFPVLLGRPGACRQPESRSPFRFRRTQRSQRLLLNGQVFCDLFIRCLDTLVTQPEGDHCNIVTDWSNAISVP
jgi:hypothetical protein